MLSFDLRALDARAVAVDGELPADDAVWEDGDLRPDGAVRVSGRLSAAGAGRYYFSGHIAGTLVGECRRCLTGVSADVDADVHFIFAEADVEGAEDDADAFVLEPGAPDLDLRPAVRDEWVLDAPAFPLCRDDCKGLCPSCGADRNTDACACAPSGDARWDALRAAGPGSSSD